MNKTQASYRILESFAYPATLGAALAWWIQAVAVRLDGETPRPTYWALCFGLWFLAYHSIWYGFLITAERKVVETVDDAGVQKKITDILPKEYGRLTLVTDFVDTALMMIGFIGLGFAAGHYDKTRIVVVFSAVLSLALSAALANFPEWWKLINSPGDIIHHAMTYPLPFTVAIGIPLCGVLMNAFGIPCEAANWILLGFLLFVLVAYIVRPKVFSSHRGLA